jgi:RimJ/RimL family protein N-acetyltransferase
MSQQYKCLDKQVFSKENYSIVPIRMEDRYAIMQWRNEQIYHLRQNKLLTKEEQDVYFNTVITGLFNQEQPNQILFSYLEGDKCIGYGGLVHINWLDMNAEISLVMDTKLQAKYFVELWVRFLHLLNILAFKEIGLHKIYTYAFDVRLRLYNALFGAGFTEDARLKEHCKVDGKYLDVLIHSLINPLHLLLVRPANIDDAQLLYKWANDPTVRTNSLNNESIKWDQHLSWLKNKVNSANSEIYIFETKQKAIGQVRLDRIGEFWEIDYSIDAKYRGLGYGKEMISRVIEDQMIKNFKAVVKQENIASSKVFSALNFEKSLSNDTEFNSEKKILIFTLRR